MLIPIFCAVIGLCLIYLEFFAPGGIVGICGALFIVVGFVFGLIDRLPLVWHLGYGIVTLVCVGFTVKLALRNMKRVRSFYPEEHQGGYVASSYDAELIGKRGVTATVLKPSGYVELDGRLYQAVSEGEYLSKGTEVGVTGGRGAALIVSPSVVSEGVVERPESRAHRPGEE
ncbi:MAG: NfeD family protein [Simkaniaceae bacterium]|nr:NfeD family protein [Simkaniaceae bacterium]